MIMMVVAAIQLLSLVLLLAVSSNVAAMSRKLDRLVSPPETNEQPPSSAETP